MAVHDSARAVGWGGWGLREEALVARLSSRSARQANMGACIGCQHCSPELAVGAPGEGGPGAAALQEVGEALQGLLHRQVRAVLRQRLRVCACVCVCVCVCMRVCVCV